ncbi:unnamed protein product [Schistosoma rodhaini]|uniref:Uncharacterized protein n=1 Tax=Schistosoma rodhaini TaxID=6188 RepID=A0AA85FCM5_9TREM|nr:unnamed protein product [Schistosoma rodhaini]
MAEHIPKLLQKQMNFNGQIKSQDGQTPSSIAKHSVETGHKININSLFVVLYKSIQGRMPMFIEALAIQKLKTPYVFKNNLFLLLTYPGNTDLLSRVVITLFLCTLCIFFVTAYL